MSEELNPEYLEKISQFCLLDDDFMSVVFKKKELAQLLLRVILNIPDLTVDAVDPQYDIKNLYGRSVRLDILAKDSSGKIFNIEVQRNDEYANPERARLNGSLLDVNFSRKGKKKITLPETYVIFITEHDYFKRGKPLYKFERMDADTFEPFGDGSHIIYVNGENRDDTALGRLMADFACKDPGKFHYKELAEETSYYKHDEKGVRHMCKIMEDIRNDGHKDACKQIALKMIEKGNMTFDEIAELTQLSFDEVKALAEGRSA